MSGTGKDIRFNFIGTEMGGKWQFRLAESTKSGSCVYEILTECNWICKWLFNHLMAISDTKHVNGSAARNGNWNATEYALYPEDQNMLIPGNHFKTLLTDA